MKTTVQINIISSEGALGDFYLR